jgi:hypothetical protein
LSDTLVTVLVASSERYARRRFRDAKAIRKFGDVPEDVSELD